MTRYESVLESIGGTPLIRLTRAAEGLAPRIYVKPEWQNPGGGVKDRAALAMLRAAEADGSLRPGGTVVEVTSGNTGIGLALVAAHLGYRAVIFTSSAIAAEKRAQVRAYGAQLRTVDTFVPRDHPDSLRSHAERFAIETPGAWLAGQYDNPANPAAHHATTGPEIWADTEGRVTHFVATVGTGGTISGTGRYLKEVSDGRVRVIGADPVTSAYAGGDGSQKYIEGAGHFVHPEALSDPWPKALDLDVIDEVVGIEDGPAIAAVRDLAATEGILAGGSSGLALVAALRLARDLGPEDLVVALLPDSGRSYLSTYFDDDWLAAQGFATTSAGPSVIDVASAPAYVDGDEPSAVALRRLVLSELKDDDVLLVRHRRERRTLPPHPSDVVGWTTPAGLRAGEPTRPVTARVGGGLALDHPAAAAWVTAGDPAGERTEVALVLLEGRVAGVLTRP